MIQITLQFNTIDEAIVFLSKQHPVAKVRNAAAIEPIAGASTANQAGARASAGGADVRGAEGQQTSQTAPATNKRKPRADAGKPRGRRGATNVEGAGTTASSASTEIAADAKGGDPVTLGGPSATQTAAAPSAPQTAAPTTQEEVTDKGSASTSDAAAPIESTATNAPAPQTAAPTAPAEADNAQPSGVVPSGAAAPIEASEKDAQDAIQKVFTQQGGPQLALDTLASFGVKRCRDLKPEQRGDFVAKCNEILAPKTKT